MVTPPAERGARYQSPEVERLPSSAAFLTLRSATLPPWEGGRELGACASLRGCRLGVLCLKSRGTDTLALLRPQHTCVPGSSGYPGQAAGPFPWGLSSPTVVPRTLAVHPPLPRAPKCFSNERMSSVAASGRSRQPVQGSPEVSCGAGHPRPSASVYK